MACWHSEHGVIRDGTDWHDYQSVLLIDGIIYDERHVI